MTGALPGQGPNVIAPAMPPSGAAAEDGGAALYRQVHDALRAELRDGRPGVGGSLPSEAALSRRFGVSRITVRHALQLLQADGLITKAKARRAVVAATEPAAPGWVIQSLDDIATMVGDARLDVRSWRRERSAANAHLLGCPAETWLPCLRGVLQRGGQPYARSVIYFAPRIGARLRRAAFDDVVVFRVMQRELGIELAYVEVTVSVASATPADAACLPCIVGDPLLETRLRYHDRSGQPVELAYSRGLPASSRFAVRITARTPPARV
jgi:GntR family transcriptional regulator